MIKPPLTIKETQVGLIKKEFSASELVNEYLKRIEKNKELNAFLTTCEDAAFEKAKQFDDSSRTQENIGSFPLAGVTVAYKDIFLTKGVRTTASSKVLESYVPAYSSTVVERMEKAGAITLGKTNCDAWAHGASGENSDFGPIKNPWNRDYVPGGSSSGSAAAVAAGLSLVATGTDTGGSIRNPANFCGVVGLKPTYGAVSRYGIIAMASSLDSPGCFGLSVDDVEAVFNVIKGPDGFDSTVKEGPSVKPKSKLKIGLPKEYFIKGINKEVEQCVTDAAKVLEKEGIELKEISIPHTKYAIDIYYIVQPAEVSSNLGRFDGIKYGNDRNSFGDEAKRRIMLGTYVLSAGYYDAYYLKAQKVRTLLRDDFDRVFSEVDAIISPVTPTPAFKLGEKSDDPLAMYLADVFTVSANLVGVPGLAIPSGFSLKGLPLGFQLMGPRFSEPMLFDLGKVYEKAMDYKPEVAL